MNVCLCVFVFLFVFEYYSIRFCFCFLLFICQRAPCTTQFPFWINIYTVFFRLGRSTQKLNKLWNCHSNKETCKTVNWLRFYPTDASFDYWSLILAFASRFLCTICDCFCYVFKLRGNILYLLLLDSLYFCKKTIYFSNHHFACIFRWEIKPQSWTKYIREKRQHTKQLEIEIYMILRKLIKPSKSN